LNVLLGKVPDAGLKREVAGFIDQLFEDADIREIAVRTGDTSSMRVVVDVLTASTTS
jgi:hypothetical protein